MPAIIAVTILYISSLTNTLFGGDAGDFLAAILTQGFPHPPGYPLYTILGILVSALPLPLTPAGKVSIISLIATVLSLYVLARIIKEIAPGGKINALLLSTALLVTGCNYIVWIYSVVPEAFPLNTLITLSIFFAGVRYYKTTSPRYLYALALLVGLGISHHHTFVIGFGATSYLLYQKRKTLLTAGRKHYMRLLLLLASGLVPFLYLFVAYARRAEIVWEKVDSLQGFLALVLRLKYGGFLAAPLVLTVPQNRFSQITKLLVFMESDFMRFGLVLIALGAIYLLRHKKIDKKIVLMFTGATLLYGPVFLFYANFPLLNPYFIATVERYLHIYYFLLGVFLYFGLVSVLELYQSGLKKIIKNRALVRGSSLILCVVLFAYPTTLFLRNYRQIFALKNDRTAERLGMEILRATPSRSLIFLTSDLTLFNTQYVFYAQPQLKKERVIIHPNKLFSPFYKEMLGLRYPEVIVRRPVDRQYQIVDVMADNMDRYAIFSEDYHELPPKLKAYDWVPYGMVYRLEPKDQREGVSVTRINKFWEGSYSREIATDFENNIKYKNLFTAEVLRHYERAHQLAGLYLLAYGDPQDAYLHIKQAIYLNSQEKTEAVTAANYYILAGYYSKIGDCKGAEKNILEAYHVRKKEEYLVFLAGISKDCYHDGVNKARIDALIKKLVEAGFKSIDKL